MVALWACVADGLPGSKYPSRIFLLAALAAGKKLHQGPGLVDVAFDPMLVVAMQGDQTATAGPGVLVRLKRVRGTCCFITARETGQLYMHCKDKQWVHHKTDSC